MTPKVAFVTSHPIQYQIPVFRHLTERGQIDLTVLFAQLPDARQQGAGFGVDFEWDIPLLEGYQYAVLENVSRSPSVTEFSGCDTPTIGHQLATLGVDAVVVNGWVVKTCLQTLWACKRLKLPLIVRGEANDLRPRAGWKRWLQSLLVRQYSAHLYIGQANRAFYVARGVKEPQLFFSPYCIENERFATCLDWDKSTCRDEFNLPDETTVFLFSGKLEEKKRPLDLISAIIRARDAGARVHALVVGDGPLRTECEQVIAETKAPVTMAGFVNQGQIPRAYRAADCLVLPSDHGETWGLVVNEAMACGLPAIASDQVGCVSDLIQDHVTGFQYPCGDISRLTELLLATSRSTTDLPKLGRDARRRVQGYSPEVAAAGIENAIGFVTRTSQSPLQH